MESCKGLSGRSEEKPENISFTFKRAMGSESNKMVATNGEGKGKLRRSMT